MDQTAIRLRWLSLAVVVACACGRAAAADIGGFHPAAASQIAPAAPAPGSHDQANMRPLDPGTPPPAAANRFATAYPYPERTASASDNLTTAAASAAPRRVDAQHPLPLSGPTKGDPRGNEAAQQMTPLATGAASLGIVLGLFLLVVLVARRGTPGGTSVLPREAIEVLGRAPFIARQHVHLVRCGNKLLLVCVSPSSTQTLTEITDPAEVDHLLAMCQGSKFGGSAIGRWFRQFGNRRRDRGDYVRHEDADLDFAHLEALHHSRQEAHA